MGGSSSTHGEGNLHSEIPEDVLPYNGALQEYRVVAINCQSKQKCSGKFLSNLNDHIDTLEQQYQEQFKLNNCFHTIFTLEHRTCKVILSYQAILSKEFLNIPTVETWQLEVSQSSFMLTTRNSGDNVDTDMVDIFNMIREKSEVGGQLSCLVTDGSRKDGKAPLCSGAVVFGVSMFFNMPVHPNPVIYSCMAYNVPMEIKRSGNRKIKVEMDIDGTLAMHVGQGWKMVHIICPMQETGTLLRRRGTRSLTVDTIWFFEKEVERINANDLTPRYEVTVIDVTMPVKTPCCSCRNSLIVQCEFGPLLTKMGDKGWTLVCLLDTPELRMSNFRTIKVTLKAFFQRPVYRHVTYM